MTHHVAEIVTFKLAKGVTDADFVALSQQTESFVRKQSGFIARWLTKGEDGSWTDYVIWADMAAAKSVVALFPAQPFFGPLMEALDPETTKMRHEEVLWRMSA
ncbi:hypothetical protein [Epibacterium ulvae]|uniref:hypothetical protein n=1 Tax=Epibacterium ulvae TaxID=1156985 RepID=UPI002491AF1A|nr:hypothetical protein [Epibacterium ulvae]